MVDIEDYIDVHSDCQACSFSLVRKAGNNPESKAREMVGEIAEAATILPNQFGVHFLGVNRSEGAPVMKVIPRYRGESYPGAMYSRHYARLAENGWVVSGSEEMQEEFVLYFGRADAMLE